MQDNQFDLMILGTGPAGITAALYGQRLGLKTVAFGDIPGGTVYMIEKLMNYPGFIGGIPGTQFGVAAFEQARSEGAHFTMSRLEEFTAAQGLFIGTDTNKAVYRAATAIVATGRVPKRIAVAKANLKGMHFCSICDGPLFRGQNATLAVVGSDNAAGQHALTLARIAAKVLLICRSDALLMDAVHQNLIKAQDNIEVMRASEVIGYEGLDIIEALKIRLPEGGEQIFPVDGVFMAVGWRPNIKHLNVNVDKTAEGYLKTDASLMTSVPGLFAAGDVRDTDMWQVLTACADGARAAKHAADFLGRK